MATQIIIKHSSGTTTPTLNYGELAINFKNGSEALYTKNSNNEIVAFNTWTKILGKPTTLSGYGIIDALGINSNAASATKLANTRTIWGQSFDGSENVSGAMTTVTSITMNGALSGATTGNFSSTLNVSGNTTLKGLTITNGTKSITLTVDVDGNLKLDNATSGASFYATGEVSAYGSGSTYGGGGGGSVNVLDSTALGGVYLDSDVTNTFNAYTIKSINTRLIDVEANGAMSIAFSGTGNAITNVTKSGTTLTFVKGVTVQDNLTYSTSGTTYALSAYQGYLLNRNDITAISASTSTLTLTRAAGNLTFSVPTWNQSTTGSAGSVANSLILTVTGGTTEGTNKYTFNGATAKTLNFVAGSNVSLVAAAGSVTISAIDTIYTHPTQTALSAGGTRHFITGIGVNTLGHVTGVTSSAMTKTDIDAVLTGSTSSHTHSYLPLSGGTMTGRVYMGSNDLYLNASDSGDIVFSDASNAQYARIWGNSSGLRLSGTSGTTEDVLLINGSTFTYDGNKIWHAGNDGSGSGLDADTLDGYHKPAFSQEFNYGTTAGNSGYYKIKILTTSQWMLCFTIRLYQGYKYYDIVISGYQYGVNYWYSPNAKLLSSSENTLAVNFGYDSVDNLWVAIPAGSYTGLKICNVTNGYNQVEQNWSSLFSVQNVSSLTGTIQTTVTAKRPLVYDENAVSATKLANTITIWGQNFNGEGNVSGNLSDLSQIKFSTSAYPETYIWSNANGLHLNCNSGSETALSISATQNVRIGTAVDAGYKLDVNGTGRFSGEFVVPKGGRFGSPNSDNPNKYGLSFRSDWSATNPWAGMYFGSTSASGKHGSVIGNSAMYFTMDDTTNRGWIFRQNFTGVEQNVASISNTGNITASGEITAYSASDIRLKSDIQQLTNSLDIINKLNPVSYKWNDTAKELNPNKTDGEDYGLIAQELEDVLPNLVHNVYDKYKSIDYVKLVPFLVAGMQEQQLEIENLKSEISGLKSEVLLLNKKIKLLQYGLE